ncbi:MAG: hypothetical protein HY719_13535, partial [Planctomycetes bacterium]|nr:hypothetical protein [Planctomycetota bacterium]
MNMTLRTPPIHARAPRPALLAAAFLLALVAAGCFEYEEELTIRKDRSGVARIRCRWTGDYKPLMDAIPSQVSTSEIQR